MLDGRTGHLPEVPGFLVRSDPYKTLIISVAIAKHDAILISILVVFLVFYRRILSSAFPFASSSINLSR